MARCIQEKVVLSGCSCTYVIITREHARVTRIQSESAKDKQWSQLSICIRVI